MQERKMKMSIHCPSRADNAVILGTEANLYFTATVEARAIVARLTLSPMHPLSAQPPAP